jgi:hypothetical protein
MAEAVFGISRSGDFHDVGGKDGEVGELTGFDGGFVLFFERRRRQRG